MAALKVLTPLALEGIKPWSFRLGNSRWWDHRSSTRIRRHFTPNRYPGETCHVLIGKKPSAVSLFCFLG